ncbi:hypothetical protein SAMN05216191_1061 [Paenibacillus jilunlii]|uniref:Uncharacterized protein n=1 Tax=Paenibacillus jilunlii TaxID=682956 RepID=A0A1G9N1P5_9BACL|nr:hypothetical protein AML91_12640 [Paenibacillus jilunlii]SDL80294.1 hypothetical protein SAMN05216191_1061 [Paenibacillus jilunlii]
MGELFFAFLGEKLPQAALYEEMKGKNTSEFAAGGPIEEMRGKNTSEFATGGLYAEMRGKNTSEFTTGMA